MILAVAAVAMTLPALWTGLLFDDLWHWAELAGPEQVDDRLSRVGVDTNSSGELAAAMTDLFVVVSPKKNLRQLVNYGALPWWTYDRLKVSAWRPVSSVTHWLDYRLFGDCPLEMHIHNLAWLALAVALITMLYRRLLGACWIAGLAAVF